MQNSIFRLPKTCLLTAAGLVLAVAASAAAGKYTTNGQDIVDRETGERVILRGFGLGGWLLPEGYMWGIREVNRPRQFEAGIVDLIGEEDAAEFWRLYREHFVTESDIAAMKAWGSNTVRIPLLASMLQPREGQPVEPPFDYDEEAFAYLDRLVDWCERHDLGVIWDMHGAPGGQNAENISDSDGEARLWTEPETYWPRCIDLWMKIVRRYEGRDCIVGYDLLNEPLLRRYEGIDPALLREFYVRLTGEIRTVDTKGIIFIEGDDWAQNFEMLEPLDWDPHLVVAFHSYPPTTTAEGMARWDRLREEYDVPLWHGETGEQGPPYAVNRASTEFLESANVGWSWWTHKKFERLTQPWMCPRTEGFERILAYWRGEGERPTREEARAWLFEQARLTASQHCVFIPEMVASLEGLDPGKTPASAGMVEPRIVRPPEDASAEEGGAAAFIALASGGGLTYTWLRDGEPVEGEDSFRLRLNRLSPEDDGATFALRVSNERGEATSPPARLDVRPFSGPVVPRTERAPEIDGRMDGAWEGAVRLPLEHVVIERGAERSEPAPTCRVLWDAAALYLLVQAPDRVLFSGAGTPYENDGVEIYLDADNDKAEQYGAGDFRFRSVWSREEVLTRQDAPARGLSVAHGETPDGYLMEFVLPWSVLGIDEPAGRYVGFDVHVNDNDGQGRLFKHAWHGRRDDAHLAPARLGTIRLQGE